MTNTIESVCRTTLRQLDAFLDHELDAATAQTLQQHLDQCIACSRELTLRTDLRSRVRQAVLSDSPAPFLETRIMANLRQHERRSSPWLQRSAWVSALTAMLIVAVAGTVAYQLGNLRWTVAMQTSYVDSMVQKVSFGMRPGLSDHIHCAYFRKYTKPPAIETLQADLGPDYQGLLKLVTTRVPSEYRVYMAHQCGFRDRRFVHIALKSDSGLMSLILTQRRPGESMGDNQLAPVIARGGLNLYGASAQRFQISGFETPTHFAYLVTDSSPAETHRLMLAMGADIREFLSRLPA
jgi:hypothetical protein